jgi:hypothetical protein
MCFVVRRGVEQTERLKEEFVEDEIGSLFNNEDSGQGTTLIPSAFDGHGHDNLSNNRFTAISKGRLF